MKAYWLNNGEPLTEGKHAGRYGRVTDLEDGTNPVTTYGASKDEVMGKIERTMMHAQQHMARAAAPKPPAPANPPKTAPAVRRTQLTPEETMQATADLTDPAKAPQAVRRLVESATGLNFDELTLEAFGNTCQAWQNSHPEFFDHPTNVKLIADNAIMRAGGMKNVNAAVLDLVYRDLLAGNFLLSQDELATNDQPQTPAAPPEQTPASRADSRPRNFATGHRSTQLQSRQGVTWKPKYTREEIDTMPLAKAEKLLRSNDQDYTQAVEHWYPSSGSKARTA